MPLSQHHTMSYSERLHKVIPGGAHTYSRGDDQYPSNAPQLLEKGKGAYVSTPNGQQFLDYGMALRAITLGYANDEVNQAAFEEIQKGNNLTRASLTELRAAELLSNLVPSAEMVKFAKNGSNVTTAAIKLARSYTNRKYVAVCADHPFFSFDDWFIGTTKISKGIPTEHHQLSLLFRYNEIDSLERLFKQYDQQIAAVILEPVTSFEPTNNFLQQIRSLCTQYGTVLIFDEMITGFRWHIGGAQSYFNVKPDLTTFGKAMANGFSVAAIAGRREIMQMGSIVPDGMERTFLLSSTHGAEMSSLGAFIKTIEIYKRDNVIDKLWNYGHKLVKGINELSRQHKLIDYFYVDGYACSPIYITKGSEGQISLKFKTLFMQEMIKHGVLIPWLAFSSSHSEKELELTLTAIDKTLKIYSEALTSGVEKFLESNHIVKPVFRQYN